MTQDPLPQLEGTSLSGRVVRLPQDLPDHPLTLVVGYTRAASPDVAAWGKALTDGGLPFLSLPTAALDTLAEDMEGVAAAMRLRVPRRAWDQVVQIHQGGEALRRQFGWQVDAWAKVLRVAEHGQVLSRHDSGPFSEAALLVWLC
jgi:hypothetical protein